MAADRRLAAVALASLLVLSSCSDSTPEPRPGTEDDGGVDEPTNLSVFELRKGDCLNTPDGDPKAELDQIAAVPCTDPHDLEVFGHADFTEDDAYPGEETLSGFAEGQCVSQFAGYVGVDYLDSTLYVTYLLPTLQSWTSKRDRTVVCLLTQPQDPLVGSQRSP